MQLSSNVFFVKGVESVTNGLLKNKFRTNLDKFCNMFVFVPIPYPNKTSNMQAIFE